jgi:hypothetical protein
MANDYNEKLWPDKEILVGHTFERRNPPKVHKETFNGKECPGYESTVKASTQFKSDMKKLFSANKKELKNIKNIKEFSGGGLA